MIGERNQLQLRPTGQAQCPLCREVILEEDAGEEHLHECAGCQTIYHGECLVELGGCATLGCDQRGVKPRIEDRTTFELDPARLQELRTAVREEGESRERRIVGAHPTPPRSSLGSVLQLLGVIGFMVTIFLGPMANIEEPGIKILLNAETMIGLFVSVVLVALGYHLLDGRVGE